MAVVRNTKNINYGGIMAEQSKGADEKYCESCGAIIKHAAEICPKCGVRQKGIRNNSTSVKKKSTAGVLALFLGGVGVHHFYLGNAGRGVVYLLFCWTFVPAVIAIVEAIMIFSPDEEVFNEKYNY